MPKTDVKVRLIGQDGNAFAIIGRVIRAMREAGVSKEIIAEYQKEAMSGDYEHLLATTLEYVTEGSDDEDECCDFCGMPYDECECYEEDDDEDEDE